MSYYSDKRKAASHLVDWVKNEEREPFTDFSRTMLLKYGFDGTSMKKLLEKMYPKLTIEDDLLVKK